MPEMSHEQERTQQPITNQPNKQPPPTNRSNLKQVLKGLSYEEGIKALSPQDNQEKNPSDSKEEKGANLEAYQNALGKILGTKLYEIVSKNTTPEKILEYASKAVDKLLESASQQIDKIEGLTPSDKEAAQALAGVLSDILKEKAEEYLQSEEGKALAQKISSYIGTHPWVVVSAILVVAAGAVAANISIPEIKQKFKLGKGIEAEIDAKLGKIRDITLEAISARIAYEKGRFKAEVSGQKDKDGEVTGQVKASFGDDKNNIYGVANIDKNGILSAEIGAKAKYQNLSASSGVQYKRDGEVTSNVLLTYGDQQHRLSGGAVYDFTKGSLKLSLSEEIQKDLYYRYAGLKYEEQKLGIESKDRFGDEKNYTEFTTDSSTEKIGISGLKTKGALSIGYGLTKDKEGTSGTTTVKYTSKDLSAQLDAKFGSKDRNISLSVEGHPKKDMIYKAEAEYSLVDNKLLSWGAYFGFKDPKEFEAFLIEYKHKNAQDIPIDQFKAVVEFTIKDMMFRLQDETTLKGGKLSEGRVSGYMAYPLSNDLKVIGGMTYGYGSEKTVGVRPELGLQIRNVPVTVGYDINSKTWSLQLIIPFGR